MNTILAVDLGGTKIAIAFVDAAGTITDKQKLPAAHTLAGTVEQIGSYSAGAIGIIVPGIYNPSTGEAWAPNLWGQANVPLRDAIARQTGVPVFISSDRSGYVLGEQWLGVARGLLDVIFVAIGTGIGVGIISGGRLIEGAQGIAGAAGWMVVGGRWKNAYASCGGWEAEAAGPAIACRAKMKSAEEVLEAARAGDKAAVAIWNRTADYIALGVANLISILNPEMVVLGGGVMQASDLILDRIRANALRWTQPIAAKQTRIEKTALGEDAGLLGAARLAWSGLHNEEYVGPKIF